MLKIIFLLDLTLQRWLPSSLLPSPIPPAIVNIDSTTLRGEGKEKGHEKLNFPIISIDFPPS